MNIQTLLVYYLLTMACVSLGIVIGKLAKDARKEGARDLMWLFRVIQYSVLLFLVFVLVMVFIRFDAIPDENPMFRDNMPNETQAPRIVWTAPEDLNKAIIEPSTDYDETENGMNERSKRFRCQVTPELEECQNFR